MQNLPGGQARTLSVGVCSSFSLPQVLFSIVTVERKEWVGTIGTETGVTFLLDELGLFSNELKHSGVGGWEGC